MLLDHPAFRWISVAALVAAAAGALFLAAQGRWPGAAALGAVAVTGAVFIAARNRLPALFTFLFVAAGLVNALGYVLNLWHEKTPFDEAVHAFTSFTLAAAAGWLIVGSTGLWERGGTLRLVLAVAATGLVLGLLWEAFEWAIGIIGGPRDTLVDLAMDLLGALAAGLFCVFVARSRDARDGAEPPERAA